MTLIKDLMSLKGRCAVVTGATGGIGHQMAITIAELGGDLKLVDLPGSDYTDLVRELSQFNGIRVQTLSCDLENGAQRSRLINDLITDNCSIDILINNAAFLGSSDLDGWETKFEEQSIDTWRRVLEVNLTAVFDLVKGLYPNLKKNGNGSIINIGSIYGISAPDYSLYESTTMGNPAAYSASKGGLIQMSRWLSTTLAPEVRVNVISPGGVYRNQPEIFINRYEARTPLKRMATEEDLKGALMFLCSDLSKYVTGQNIVVDGGWTVW